MLVGREAQVAQLGELLADDRPAVVVGEAGIGKTTLLRAVAAAAGRTVFEGGALSTLSWLQYLPLRRALGRDVAGADPTAAAADVDTAVGAGVLLLDDLQWADPATLETVSLLSGRLGLLTAVRSGAAEADAVVDRLREQGFTVVEVPPVPAGEAAALLRAVQPDLPEARIERLVERTGGNPLLLHELAGSGEPSPSLRLAIGARIRQLDETGREAFALLALAGRPLPAGVLGAGAKSLLRAGLAVEQDGALAARHALLAEVALEQVDLDERTALHARLARSVDDDGEAARHHALAGEPDRALASALRAAESATRPGERASHLAIAATCATGPEADELRLQAARALQVTADWFGLTEVLAGLSPGNVAAQAEAALLTGQAAWTGGDGEAMRAAVQRGLALVEAHPEAVPDAVAVGLRIEAVRPPLMLDGEFATAMTLAREALRLADDRGVQQARAEYMYGTAAYLASEPGCEEHLARAIASARATGEQSTEIVSGYNLVAVHESAGDPEEGRRVARRFIDRCVELGLGRWENAFRAALVNLDMHAADYRAVLEGDEHLFDAPIDRRTRDQIIESYTMALVDLGRIDEAIRRLEEALATTVDDAGHNLDWTLAEAHLWGGRPAEALRHVEQFLGRILYHGPQAYGRVTRAWCLVELGRDPGDPLPEQELPGIKGAQHETAGLKLLFDGDAGAAAHAFGTAARQWAPYHRRGELRCRWRQADALVAAEVRDEAVRLLLDLETTLTDLGMLPMLGRVVRSLRACGVRRTAPAQPSGTALLSAREAQVLSLVGDGLTNAEVAARLGLSRHTVVAQIASASAKLGASTRTQAAALATGLASG